MPSLFQAYSKLLPAYSKLFQLIPAYAQPIPSLFQAYSKLLPSLFRAIPYVFQAIPNVFQAIPALLQASPSISMTFAQEIFGSHFLVIFPLKSSAFLRFCASHVGGYCGAQSMQISRIFGDRMPRWVPSHEWSRKCSNSSIF